MENESLRQSGSEREPYLLARSSEDLRCGSGLGQSLTQCWQGGRGRHRAVHPAAALCVHRLAAEADWQTSDRRGQSVAAQTAPRQLWIQATSLPNRNKAAAPSHAGRGRWKMEGRSKLLTRSSAAEFDTAHKTCWSWKKWQFHKPSQLQYPLLAIFDQRQTSKRRQGIAEHRKGNLQIPAWYFKVLTLCLWALYVWIRSPVSTNQHFTVLSALPEYKCRFTSSRQIMDPWCSLNTFNCSPVTMFHVRMV